MNKNLVIGGLSVAVVALLIAVIVLAVRAEDKFDVKDGQVNANPAQTIMGPGPNGSWPASSMEDAKKKCLANPVCLIVSYNDANKSAMMFNSRLDPSRGVWLDPKVAGAKSALRRCA